MSSIFNHSFLDSFESCFQSLVGVSAIGSIVVLLAIVFHLAMSKSVSARWLYLFWFVILLRFVLIAAPESSVSMLNLVSQPDAAVALVDRQTSDVELDDRLIFSAEPVVPIPVDSELKMTSVPKINFWFWAAVIWFTVVVWLLGKLGRGYLSVRRLIKRSVVPSETMNAQFEDLKYRAKLKLKTQLRVTHDIDVPAMAGMFKPVVLLPDWCQRELDAEQLELIFTHELIHIQRRDGLIQLLAHLIVVLHWFNPLARLASGFIESTRELSCDRRVIELWKKMQKQGHRSAHLSNLGEPFNVERKYGRTILDIADRANRANDASQFSAAFLGGFVGVNRNLVKQRIAMLVSSRSHRWLRNVVAASFIVVLMAVGFTSAQTICVPSPPAATQICPAPAAPQVPVVVEGKLYLPALPQLPAMPQLPKLQQAATIPSVLPTPIPPMAIQSGHVEPWLPKLPASPSVPTAPTPNAMPALLPTVSIKAAALKPLPFREPIQMHVGEVKRMTLKHRMPEVMLGDPAVAICTFVAPDTLEFTAKAAGQTEIHVSNEHRQMRILRVRVVPDVRDLTSKVKKQFPDANVRVTGTTDGFVDLFGQVTTEQVSKINAFVVENCELPVRSRLSDSAPLAIKIGVFEVSKSKLKEMGVDWTKLGDGNLTKIDSLADLLPGNGKTKGAAMTIGLVEDGRFNNFLTALQQHNVAKLLDQPTLVAQDGQPAEFLSGGEIPIATVLENGKAGIEFRFFGTKIQATPHVHSEDELTLEVRAEVSEVDKTLSGETGVPGFRVRRINTGMRMKPGQTIALIGDYRNRENGDEDSTELIFMLTPRFIKSLAKPKSPAKEEAAGDAAVEDAAIELPSANYAIRDDVRYYAKGQEFKLSKEAALLKATRGQPIK